jgi:hypothetical protein
VVRSVGFGLALVLSLLATGCRDDEKRSGPARDTSTLSAAELGWIRAYSKWTFGFYDDAPDLGNDAVEACRRRVEQIGPAPTARLEEAAGRLPPICPLVQQIGSLRRAQTQLEDIDDLLLPYLRDEQPLQLRSGITDRSRADIVLSGIASDVIGDPVEVRCWDKAGWSRVVTEDNAWQDESDDPDELVGWPDESAGHIHLTLDGCNAMAAARTRDPMTLNRYDRIEAVDAIETLLHEIGHFDSDASEAEVECTAIRGLPQFLGRFGVTGTAARELTELYRTEVYPTLDDEYTEGGCPRVG